MPIPPPTGPTDSPSNATEGAARVGPAATLERDAKAFCDAVRASLRGRRIALGLSEQDVAGRADLSHSAIETFESGPGDLDLMTVFRIAAALQCRPTLVFEPAAEPAAPGAARETNAAAQAGAPGDGSRGPGGSAAALHDLRLDVDWEGDD